MKKIITILAVLILSATMFLPKQASAQAPEAMSYQAVIRDAGNKLVINQNIGMRISILQGSITGTEVYKEIFNPNPITNANGLVTIEIGNGIPMKGTFASINWSASPFFIKTEIDPVGGTNYTITGTSQLLSVPYALYAKTVESINENDPVYAESPAAGITTPDIAKLNNLSGINTGDQDLSGYATTSMVTTGLNSKIDKENSKGLSTNDYTTAEQTKLASVADGAEVNVNANWNATSGDAQILNKPTIPVSTSQLTNNSGFISSEVDGSITNEIQTLTLNSTELSISGGNAVVFNNWDTNGTNDVTTTGNQTIAGDKTFTGTVKADSLSLTNKTSKWVFHSHNYRVHSASTLNLTIIPGEYGDYIQASSIGSHWVIIPLNLPYQILGCKQTIKSVSFYYRCGSTNVSITNIIIRKANPLTGTSDMFKNDTTPLTSTITTMYTANIPTTANGDFTDKTAYMDLEIKYNGTGSGNQMVLFDVIVTTE
jgi:hypothetical protein